VTQPDVRREREQGRSEAGAPRPEAAVGEAAGEGTEPQGLVICDFSRQTKLTPLPLEEAAECEAVPDFPPVWEHRFPSADFMVEPASLFVPPKEYQRLVNAARNPEASADAQHLLRGSRPAIAPGAVPHGPTPFLQWSPGMVRIGTRDFAKAEASAERARQRHAVDVAYGAAVINEAMHRDPSVRAARDYRDAAIEARNVATREANQAWRLQRRYKRERLRASASRSAAWSRYETLRAEPMRTYVIDLGMGETAVIDNHTDAQADHALAAMAETHLQELGSQQRERHRQASADRAAAEGDLDECSVLYREEVQEWHDRVSAQPKPVAKPKAVGQPGLKQAVTTWSAKSRNKMVYKIACLDFTPMFQEVLNPPGMLTLTYSRDWEIVVPSKAHLKRHLDALQKSIERTWGVVFYAIWKLEFQRRGAPHVHLFAVPPTGTRKGLPFRKWLSQEWARIVAHPDPEERRRHVVAGTAIDYGKGLHASDPKRLAVYFLKHSVVHDKEYQHVVPDLWMANGGPGRFWGVWRLEELTVTVPLDPQTEWIQSARTLRGVARAARYNPRRENTPFVRKRRVPRVDTKTGVVRYRVQSRRVHYMDSVRGYLLVNNGPMLVSQLYRALHASPEQDAAIKAAPTAEARRAIRTEPQPTPRARLYRALREATPAQRPVLRALLENTPSTSYVGRIALIDSPPSGTAYRR
jgi:hypothetical protein